MKTKPKKLQLEEIDRFDARQRGMRRMTIPGIGIYVGHRHADADFWITSQEQILIRFATADYKHYFRVILPAGFSVSRLDIDDFADCIHDELYDWFEGARDESF